MQRNCENCGKPYVAKRNTSRFCGSSCRVAWGRKGGISPVDEPVLTEKPALLTQLELELESAGRLKTVKGQAALMAAERLVNATHDGASSYAALLRELRACVDAALDGAAVADDPLDEVRARRERKFGG